MLRSLFTFGGVKQVNGEQGIQLDLNGPEEQQIMCHSQVIHHPHTEYTHVYASSLSHTHTHTHTHKSIVKGVEAQPHRVNTDLSSGNADICFRHHPRGGTTMHTRTPNHMQRPTLCVHVNMRQHRQGCSLQGCRAAGARPQEEEIETRERITCVHLKWTTRSKTFSDSFPSASRLLQRNPTYFLYCNAPRLNCFLWESLEGLRLHMQYTRHMQQKHWTFLYWCHPSSPGSDASSTLVHCLHILNVVPGDSGLLSGPSSMGPSAEG